MSFLILNFICLNNKKKHWLLYTKKIKIKDYDYKTIFFLINL